MSELYGQSWLRDLLVNYFVETLVIQMFLMLVNLIRSIIGMNKPMLHDFAQAQTLIRELTHDLGAAHAEIRYLRKSLAERNAKKKKKFITKTIRCAAP